MTEPNQASKRSSRLREFHDCDQEWKETKNKDAAIRRAAAMGKHTLKDFERAQENIHGQRLEESARKDALLRKYGATEMREIQESDLRRKRDDDKRKE